MNNTIKLIKGDEILTRDEMNGRNLRNMIRF